jgi:hypothetical protein
MYRLPSINTAEALNILKALIVKLGSNPVLRMILFTIPSIAWSELKKVTS